MPHSEPEHSLHRPVSTEGMSLIEVIDLIRERRAEADQDEAACSYDPQDYNKRHVAGIRKVADDLEREMELRLGWRE